MPIFRYKCNDCGKEFEKLLPRFDAQSNCPACNSNNLARELNKVAVRHTGPASCSMRNDCPSAGGHSCGCGCGCGKH